MASRLQQVGADDPELAEELYEQAVRRHDYKGFWQRLEQLTDTPEDIEDIDDIEDIIKDLDVDWSDLRGTVVLESAVAKAMERPPVDSPGADADNVVLATIFHHAFEHNVSGLDENKVVFFLSVDGADPSDSAATREPCAD